MVLAVWVETFGPSQPVAVAVMVLLPSHPAVKVTAPVALFIDNPAAILAASSEYVIPVLLDAVAENVCVPEPCDLVEEGPNAKMGVATEGVIVTLLDASTWPHPPDATIVLVTTYVPAVLAAKFNSPVDEFAKTSPAVEENVPAEPPPLNVGNGLAAPWQYGLPE